MIILERLNKTKFYLNPHLIESVEETPDCIITLISGKKLIVRTKIDQILNEILEYRKKINFINQKNFILNRDENNNLEE